MHRAVRRRGRARIAGPENTRGLPIFSTARDHFTVIGAPAYRVPECLDSLHRSFIVVRTDSRAQALDDLRATRFAINELFAPLARDGRFFASTVVTGSHAASAMAVAAGEADAAAIDRVTFALLGRYRPAAICELRIIAETAPTPPLVTARSSAPHVVAALRRGLRDVLANAKYAAICDGTLPERHRFCGDSRTGSSCVTKMKRATRLRHARVARCRLGYERGMTEKELAPFVGKQVAVHHSAGNIVTGVLKQSDPSGPYQVHSADGEVPPVPLLAEEIERIVA